MAKVKKVKQKVKDLVIDGQVYKMAMDLNAMAELEEMYGSVDAGMKALEGGSFKAIRGVLYASLRSYHPEMTLLDVGMLITLDNIDELGGALSINMKENAPDNDNPNQARPAH